MTDLILPENIYTTAFHHMIHRVTGTNWDGKLLVKIIILASMFVWGFVCVSVCNRRDNSQRIRPINTKPNSQMCLCCRKVCILFGVCDIIYEVTSLQIEVCCDPKIAAILKMSKYQN